MNGDALDQKVTRTFGGKVVRKDLLHQIVKDVKKVLLVKGQDLVDK